MKYERYIKNKKRHNINKRIHSTNEKFTIILKKRIEVILNINNKIYK